MQKYVLYWDTILENINGYEMRTNLRGAIERFDFYSIVPWVQDKLG